ncbi:MAG: hypothetical protein QOF90_163, partial [Acetobacteraceae bacterium]|nr:hypothetical protein [Acetobacteraceae bacterium]
MIPAMRPREWIDQLSYRKGGPHRAT